MPEFTEQQKRAIFESGNLLVAAAAGSGKTAVLTERIARLVEDGADISAMLVVTFTKGAAGEMKRRIAKRLEKAAADAAASDAQRLYKAASDVSRASISTLHSFCQQVLRRHFSAAGIDPGFRVADETETLIMLQDAMDAMLEERFEAGDTRFLRLVEVIGGEEQLMNMLGTVRSYMECEPDPSLWLARSIDMYRLDADALRQLPVLTDLVKTSANAISVLTDEYRRARDEAVISYPTMAAAMDGEMMSLRALALASGYDEYSRMIQSDFFVKRFTWPKGTPEEDKEAVKAIRASLKKKVEAQSILFSLDMKGEAERLAAFLPFAEETASLVTELDSRYDRLKRDAGVVDFSDMEHLTLKVLSDPLVRDEYRERFSHVFVDEYQDTNRVQEAIIQAVSRGDSLFLVGDVKQSIYRFRLAEPELFIDKYYRWGRGEGGTRIDLSSNFRSAGAVIDGVNQVFSAVMSRDAAEIDYDDDAKLIQGRDCKRGACEVMLCPIGADAQNTGANADADTGDDDEGDSPAAMDAAEMEAFAAAKRIGELVGHAMTPDGSGGERPLRYGDIALLHRSLKKYAAVYTGALAMEGIPAYADMAGGYFEALEIRIFLNLLRLIDNRRQDIPLASVLHSPIGGFSAGELARLRLLSQNGSFFDCVNAAADADDALGQRARAFLDRLARWRHDSRLYSCEQLVGRLMDETGFYAFAAALPGGERRTTNLSALIERARAFEATGRRGLGRFIEYADRTAETGKAGAAYTGGADVVRVLSVHKSKGLEFPVVILAGLSRIFNLTEARDRVLCDAESGLSMKLGVDGAYQTTVLRGAAVARTIRRSVAEEMRILYVAMTRARERLIMLFGVSSIDKAVKRWKRTMTPAVAAEARCFADWVMGAVMPTSNSDELRIMTGNPPSGGPAGAIDVSVYLPQAGRRAQDADMQAVDAVLERAQSAETPFERIFGWKYPHMNDTSVPSKISVTELLHSDTPLAKAPSFMGVDTDMNAADRGTAAHALMERIAIRPHDVSSVRAEIKRLTDSGFLTEAQANAIYAPSVAAFFSSPLGKRLTASKEVRREQEFNHSLTARTVLPEYDSDALVMLQGVIDCCFIEDGEWVIIDYKTDRIADGVSPAEHAKRHERQLRMYAAALAAISGRAVKEKWIYFLRAGECVAL